MLWNWNFFVLLTSFVVFQQIYCEKSDKSDKIKETFAQPTENSLLVQLIRNEINEFEDRTKLIDDRLNKKFAKVASELDNQIVK